MKKDFYTTSREGTKSFIVQRCLNVRGCYMALVEYGGGGRRSFIFIPKELGGKGWRKMADALWEAILEKGQELHGRGGVAQRPLVVVNHPQSRLYREVLVQQNMPSHSFGAAENADRGV